MEMFLYVWGAALFLSAILTLIGQGGLMEALVKIFKTLFSNVREGFQALVNLFAKALQPLPPLRHKKPMLATVPYAPEPLQKFTPLGHNDWVEDHLSWMKPFCMDTPTLIEWIQRQLETKEETRLRHGMLDPRKAMYIMEAEFNARQLDRVVKDRPNDDIETVDIMVDSQIEPILKIRNGTMTASEARETMENYQRLFRTNTLVVKPPNLDYVKH